MCDEQTIAPEEQTIAPEEQTIEPEEQIIAPEEQIIAPEEQIIALVEQIKAQNSEAVTEMTASLLSAIFSNYQTYFPVLYKLILHTYRHAPPEMACALLKGFIQTTSAHTSSAHTSSAHTSSAHTSSAHTSSENKPLLDYLVVEAYNGLFKMGGWSLLKPCVLMLKNHKEERLYQYILASVVEQLKQDYFIEPSSDLCFNLPREKSFSWGWFSYEVAAYYTYGDTNVKLNAKQLRNCMMIYRKVLTHLRQNCEKTSLPVQAYASQAYDTPPLSWPTILTMLDVPEYQWASDIIANEVANEVADEVAVADANEVAANANEVAANANEVANEVAVANANEVAADAVEANANEADANEVAANEVANEVAVAPKEKKSWFYSLFSWS